MDRLFIATLLLAAWSSCFAQAESVQGPESLCTGTDECRAASELELDRVRGGFTVSTASGMLELSIGITRAVALNNQLVALSQVVLPDAASPQATLLATVPGATVNVAQGAVMVQNGPGNVAPSLASLTGAAQPLIVQNSLNDQTLRTLTIINASVNSLSTWRALQLGELARQAGAPFGR